MIAYLTDVEGRWDKLVAFAADNPCVRLVGDRLELADDATFVFGGDAIDRGPFGRRIVNTLLEARQRYGDRVVLLAGNRDLNKLRLRRELGGSPPARAPETVLGDRPTLLRWIFATTMGARGAFEHRQVELVTEGCAADDEDVVDSFLADLAPDGPLSAYLAACTLAWRAGPTLFVHGAVTEQSLGAVPDRPRIDGIDPWIAALNRYYADQIDAYRAVPEGSAHASIIQYQAPIPGTRANQASVVYGRTADEHNDPRLPEPPAVARLLAGGIERLIVGHTPAGDVPAVLRDGRFVLVMADNSYGRTESGSKVFVGDQLSFSGTCTLDDGRVVAVQSTLDGPVGSRAPSGHLVKAPLEDRWLLFRGLPGQRTEQIRGDVDPASLTKPLALG